MGKIEETEIFGLKAYKVFCCGTIVYSSSKEFLQYLISDEKSK